MPNELTLACSVVYPLVFFFVLFSLVLPSVMSFVRSVLPYLVPYYYCHSRLSPGTKVIQPQT